MRVWSPRASGLLWSEEGLCAQRSGRALLIFRCLVTSPSAFRSRCRCPPSSPAASLGCCRSRPSGSAATAGAARAAGATSAYGSPPRPREGRPPPQVRGAKRGGSWARGRLTPAERAVFQRVRVVVCAQAVRRSCLMACTPSSFHLFLWGGLRQQLESTRSTRCRSWPTRTLKTRASSKGSSRWCRETPRH